MSTHRFFIVAIAGKNQVLALSQYDQAPHNFQTLLRLTLDAQELQLVRNARKQSQYFPIFETRISQPNRSDGKSHYHFCLANLRQQIQTQGFYIKGQLYTNPDIGSHKQGRVLQGTIDLNGSDIEVIVNRNLPSFLPPLEVAKDVLGELPNPQ